MRNRRRATTITLGVFVLAACSGTSGDTTATPAPTTATPTTATPGTVTPGTVKLPVIVDTDGGSDDAMALLYLLQQPAVDIVAITVSGTGIVHCDPGVHNVAGLVELAAPDADIPIACGPETPLVGSRAFPAAWRDQADGRYEGILPDGHVVSSTRDASELIADAIKGAGAATTVLTLGPLTNLALALRADPGLAEQIGEVVVMGGALDVGGNVTPADGAATLPAEWNIYVDPTAAQEVLDSSAPVTFVPLDSQVPVDVYVVRTLAAAASSAPATVVSNLLRSSPFFVSEQFFLWDPLAAAAVAQPELFARGERQVMVRTDGPEAGRTVAGEGVDVMVASVLDGDQFSSSYLAALDGREEPVTIDRTPDVVVSGDNGCSATPTNPAPGPAVVELTTSGLAVALGRLDGVHSDSEIEAFLATSPDAAPPWFALTAVIQPGDATTTVLADLGAGELTAICVGVGDGAPRVTGRTTLNVAP